VLQLHGIGSAPALVPFYDLPVPIELLSASLDNRRRGCILRLVKTPICRLMASNRTMNKILRGLDRMSTKGPFVSRIVRPDETLWSG
jgi:hypothetical protein